MQLGPKIGLISPKRRGVGADPPVKSNAIKPVGRKEETKETSTKVANPSATQAANSGKKYTGGGLNYAGHPMSAAIVQTILNLCVQYNILPSGMICQLYLESFWGASNVARIDNNWSGMSGSAQTRPSGVKVTTGSARPANEGGTYFHYASVDDFMKDYAYLLAEQTSGGRKFYGVKGKQNIEDYTRGLFRVGGALYDYAAAGYGHYITLMRDIRGGVNRSNGNILDKLDDLWRQPNNQLSSPSQPVTRVVKADKTIAVINEMKGLQGRTVGSGQCYGLAAWYSMKLGGPGLGGGVTGFSGKVGAGMAAAYIGTDYAWANFGWSVVRPRGTNELKAGAMANIKAHNAFLGTGQYGHVSIIIANNGSTVTVLEQNYAGRQYVTLGTYNAQAYLGAIETLCYPPELKAGKTVEGRTETSSTVDVPVPEIELKEVTVSTTEVVIDPKKKQEWKNEKGEVEFYLQGSLLFAPLSKQLYPSVLTGTETNDNWIRKDMEVDTDNEEVLISTALRNLRKYCYPAITYEADGYFDLDIGDTVKIQDTGFAPMLVLEARVSEQQISFTNPSESKTVFANFQALQNKVSDSLLTRMAKLAEQAIPYELKLSTDQGTAFKNRTGQSLLMATLEKNGKVYEPIIFYKKGDSIIGSGSQMLVRATDFDGTLQVTVEAYLNDEKVATAEVTFSNVADGQAGAKGDKGDPGPPGPKGALDEEQLKQVNDKIDSKADQKLTAEQLNALTEAMQLAKAELEAKASIDTVNEWVKSYQDYVKSDEAGRATAEAKLVSASQRLTKVENNLGDMAERWSFLDLYMSASNEGLIIGKKDGSSSVRVESDRISFCSAGSEVAYISQGVLKIENGVFTRTLQIGRFREEQYQLNPDMNVIRYAGGI